MTHEWRKAKLGEVCELVNGRAYSKEELLPEGKYKVLRVGNFFTNDHWYYSDLELDKNKYCDDGDLLYAWSASFGPRIWTGGKVIFHYHIWKVLPNSALVDKKFLYYFFLWDTELAKQEQGAGTTMTHVAMGSMKERTIPFPPLGEQLRIVRILDNAFAALATAKQNTESSIQNARAVFQTHLESVFTQRGAEWPNHKLGEICVVERGSSPRPIKDFITTRADGVNWIKIGDTKEGGKYIYSTAQKITREGAKQSRFVKENDFILTNSMSFGRPYIVKTSGYIHDGWFVLRLNRNLNLDYFYYLLASNFVRSQFNNLASGSVVLNISSDLVKRATLPIPPLKVQEAIGKDLENLAESIEHLESIQLQKIPALAELKAGLLRQAFTGML